MRGPNGRRGIGLIGRFGLAELADDQVTVSAGVLRGDALDRPRTSADVEQFDREPDAWPDDRSRPGWADVIRHLSLRDLAALTNERQT